MVLQHRNFLRQIACTEVRPVSGLPAALFFPALLMFFLVLVPLSASAQSTDPPEDPETEESSPTPPDTLETPQTPALPDTLDAAETPALPDTLAPDLQLPGTQTTQQRERQPRDDGQLTDPVNFSARDSLKITLIGERIATLFGNAAVEHPSGRLTAGKITLRLDQNTAEAEARRLPLEELNAPPIFTEWLERRGEYFAPVDTLSEPTLTRDGEEIRSRRILFNYVTEKGKFDVARIKMDDGHVTGTQVKAPAPHVIFIEDAIYSTCDLDHPHYYIRANRMKVVDEDEIFFTRAQIYILDIPYPMIFPFGYIPSGLREEQSGLLSPRFVLREQSARGLGVEEFGWFQYFNDYLTGTFRGSLYTSGTYFLDSDVNYALRDRFRGSVRIGYSREQGLEPTDPDFSKVVNSSIQINHQHTFSPFASGTANINLRTSDYFVRNSYDIDERAETTTSSRVSYNYRHPTNLYNFSLSMQQSQNFATDVVSLQGPTMNYSFQRFNPFERRRSPGDQRWYETLSIGYSGQFNSRFEFRPMLDAEGNPVSDINWTQALFSASDHREATGSLEHIRYGFNQRADINAQLTTSDYVNVSTNARINEYWYPETVRKELNEETNQVEDRIEPGFAAARTFNTSLSMSTTVYGISNMQVGSLQGFRHTMRPSVSFSYQPDFSTDFWGYFRETERDTLGNTLQYSIFERGLLGGPSAGEQRVVSFSLSNIFETKQVSRDSTGERNERVIRLIDDLRANLSYNFAAEQFRLSDLTTSLTSNILQNIRINANATFSPYAQDSLGRRIDQYLWDDGDGILRLTSYTINASTRISGGSGGPRIEPGPGYYPRFYDPWDQHMFRGIDRAFYYDPVQPISVPWSASLRFSYNWRFIDFNNEQRSAVLNVENIQARLTKGWNVGTSLGYDFIEKELTPSRFFITRNLHCWNMSFEWNPFGDFKFFRFALTISDTQMRSIFNMLPGLNDLERRDSPIGRF